MRLTMFLPALLTTAVLAIPEPVAPASTVPLSTTSTTTSKGCLPSSCQSFGVSHYLELMFSREMQVHANVYLSSAALGIAIIGV